MFRREIPTGETSVDPPRFSVTGLWGSGNTVGERASAFAGDGTSYTLWDGRALFGPGRPGRLEKLPALVSVLDAAEFRDRYAALGAGCTMWTGDEEVGIGCDEACASLVEVCDTTELDKCLASCVDLPRSVNDCIGAATTCWEDVACRLGWADARAKIAAALAAER